MPLIDAEYYLEELQKYNFEVFDSKMMKPSYIKVPFRMRAASKAGRFTHHDLKYYQ